MIWQKVNKFLGLWVVKLRERFLTPKNISALTKFNDRANEEVFSSVVDIFN